MNISKKFQKYFYDIPEKIRNLFEILSKEHIKKCVLYVFVLFKDVFGRVVPKFMGYTGYVGRLKENFKNNLNFMNISKKLFYYFDIFENFENISGKIVNLFEILSKEHKIRPPFFS